MIAGIWKHSASGLKIIGINAWKLICRFRAKPDPMGIPLNPKGYRNIIWRSRATKTPELLAKIIVDKDTPGDELPRFFRAFDFQKDSPIKNEALVKLAFGDYADPARHKLITSEALARIKSLDLKSNPQHAAAVNKLLDGSRNSPMYVELVGKFNLVERYPSLLAIAQNQPGEQLGIDAMKLLLERDAKLALPGLTHKDINAALATVQAIGNSAHVNGNALLLPIVQDDKADLELRRQATRALAKNRPGDPGTPQAREVETARQGAGDRRRQVLATSSTRDIRAAGREAVPAADDEGQEALARDQRPRQDARQHQ